jgi:hypothetical protein
MDLIHAIPQSPLVTHSSVDPSSDPTSGWSAEMISSEPVVEAEKCEATGDDTEHMSELLVSSDTSKAIHLH